MKHTTRFVLFVTVLISTSLACGSSSPSNQDSQVTAPATETQVAGEIHPQADRLLPGVDIPEIELLMPTEGVGLKPKFEWKAVDGATVYSLMLKNADGETYWAWMGNTTYIYLGSVLTAPPEDSAGPILQPGMSWAVAAYDAEHHLLATSAYRSISP